MNILITGAGGFIGQNLQAFLLPAEDMSVLCAYRDTDENDLKKLVSSADCIVHLAGVNRPKNDEAFARVNTGYTESICKLAALSSKKIPIIFSSSTQIDLDNAYGRSKLAAENVLLEYSARTGAPVHILRLPNVMGKWCRPDYNSVVATFCYNISHGLPIEIHNPETELTLVYIDDLVQEITTIIQGKSDRDTSVSSFPEVHPQYKIKLAELAQKIQGFHDSRQTLCMGRVAKGLDRALYATYLSYLDTGHFSYPLVPHEDERGIFVEILKTRDSGQFSFLSAHPGITRGTHYHLTKTEKFLVVKGQATFRFRRLFTEDVIEIEARCASPKIVETIPGWVHDITNTGEEELIVLIWANETFDPEAPDTFAASI
jgi:UDP-2-acetamido-2,6-beta-L-arabino-hexul-4-ose reductase